MGVQWDALAQHLGHLLLIHPSDHHGRAFHLSSLAWSFSAAADMPINVNQAIPMYMNMDANGTRSQYLNPEVLLLNPSFLRVS